MPEVTALYVWLVTSPSGEEMVLGARSPAGAAAPAVSVSEAVAEQLRPMALRFHHETGCPVRLVRFSTRTVIGPPVGAH